MKVSAKVLRSFGVSTADVAAKTTAYLRALAVLAYREDEGNEDVSYPYSPARATSAIAEATGIPRARLVALVAGVYYVENGTRSPLSLPANATPKSLASAIRKARDAGGRLSRWEVLAVRASVALGRPVSEPAVRALYAKGGGDLAASYVGRGTRVAAPKTREDETAEVEATLNA